MSNLLRENLIRTFREQQQKYAYYLIALCVAGIGFSIQQTQGLALNCTQIPLGIAVILWGSSIHCGLMFLKLQIVGIWQNVGIIDVGAGQDPNVGNNPNYVAFARKLIREAIEKGSKKTIALAIRQNRFFYTGIISFVVWRLIEMYCLAPK